MIRGRDLTSAPTLLPHSTPGEPPLVLDVHISLTLQHRDGVKRLGHGRRTRPTEAEISAESIHHCPGILARPLAESVERDDQRDEASPLRQRVVADAPDLRSEDTHQLGGDSGPALARLSCPRSG